MPAKENDKMTIEQVAAALGVSKTTVSRALSGKGRISEETRARVYAYIGMGNARSEPAPVQITPKLRTNNIAMVMPQRFITLDLPFLRKCMGGICTMADQRGYDMLVCYSSYTEYTQLQRQLASHKVDGVILTYAMADDPCVDLLRQYDVPFVLIGRSEDKTIPQADNDQVAAACEMTRILLQMGAKRIALLVGSTRRTACCAATMKLPTRSCASCATGIFWCRRICALPACTTARCWPALHPRYPPCSMTPSSWGAPPAVCCWIIWQERKRCSARSRGIRLSCASPPNGMVAPMTHDNLCPKKQNQAKPEKSHPRLVRKPGIFLDKTRELRKVAHKIGCKPVFSVRISSF